MDLTALPTPTRKWTRTGSFFDNLARLVTNNTEAWHPIHGDEVVGPTIGAKQARIHGEMKKRGLKVETRSLIGLYLYVRAFAEPTPKPEPITAGSRL